MTIRTRGTLTGTGALTTSSPSKIRDASAILAAKTDELNAKIGAAEQHFASLKLGVETYVDISTNDERLNNQYVHLWFEKENADWRFVIRTGDDREEEEEHDRSFIVVNLLKTKKEFRIRAARAFPQLLGKMIAEAERQIAEVDDAIKSVERAMAGEVEPVSRITPDDEIPF